MSETLQERIESAILWSLHTWHFYNYKSIENATVTSIAGELYHVSFTLDGAEVNALYLDVQGDKQCSLFLDSDTLTWVIEQRVEAYVESQKPG
jgi:hypothetical protein